MAVAVVPVVGLGVAIVETASAVEMRARGDHVHALRLAAGGDARGGIVAITHHAGEGRAVDVAAARRHGKRVGGNGIVLAADAAGRRGSEIVVPRRLVVN